MFSQQGDALEQGHHPKGVSRLHPQATEGAAESQRDGDETEET